MNPWEASLPHSVFFVSRLLYLSGRGIGRTAPGNEKKTHTHTFVERSALSIPPLCDFLTPRHPRILSAVFMSWPGEGPGRLALVGGCVVSAWLAIGCCLSPKVSVACWVDAKRAVSQLVSACFSGMTFAFLFFVLRVCLSGCRGSCLVVCFVRVRDWLSGCIILLLFFIFVVCIICYFFVFVVSIVYVIREGVGVSLPHKLLSCPCLNRSGWDYRNDLSIFM